MDVHARIEALVLAVHRRNGGSLDRLDFGLRLLDPALGLDSLDLAEVVVNLERVFGRSPFDAAVPPRTWADLAGVLQQPLPPAIGSIEPS